MFGLLMVSFARPAFLLFCGFPFLSFLPLPFDLTKWREKSLPMRPASKGQYLSMTPRLYFAVPTPTSRPCLSVIHCGSHECRERDRSCVSESCCGVGHIMHGVAALTLNLLCCALPCLALRGLYGKCVRSVGIG